MTVIVLPHRQRVSADRVQVHGHPVRLTVGGLAIASDEPTARALLDALHALFGDEPLFAPTRVPVPDPAQDLQPAAWGRTVLDEHGQIIDDPEEEPR